MIVRQRSQNYLCEGTLGHFYTTLKSDSEKETVTLDEGPS